MLLAFMIVFLTPGDLVIRQTELYQPLKSHHVAFGENGGIFFVNQEDKYIAHYDAKGVRLPNIGSSGGGPGQFLIPFNIFLDKDRLFVHDFWRHRVVCYDTTGRFLENLEQPAAGLGLLKVDRGWIYIKLRFDRQGGPNRMVITGEAFTDPLTLFEWKADWHAVPSEFYPVLDTYQLAASADKKTVYFYKPGSFEIYRIDVAARQMSSFIVRDFQALPFDEQWGLEEFRRQPSAGGSRPPLKPVFPATFPTITDLAVSPWNTLWVVRGNRPDLARAMEFDLHGQELAAPVSAAFPRRILAYHKDWALVSFSGPDESVEIHRIPVAKVKPMLTADP